MTYGEISFVLPLEDWRRTPGRPRIMRRLRTVQSDLKCHNLTLTVPLDMSQNRSLWRLLATFSATRVNNK